MLPNHRTSQCSNLLSPLPPLPPEIWRIIMAFAARPCVHGSSALDAPDSGHSPDPLALAVAATRPTVLRTKLSLLLVSKHWHEMAWDILYEHVIFTSQESLTQILAAIAESGSETSPFRSTKSLVLCTIDWEEWDIPVVKVITLCENLRALVLTRPFPINGNRTRLVINAIPSTLVALAFIGWCTAKIVEMLSSFQKLEILSLLSSWHNGSTCRPIFPHVRHITLSHDHWQGWGSHFPDAHHLSIIISQNRFLPSGATFQNFGTTDQKKVAHLSIGIETWFPKYMKFGDIICARFIRAFQNLVILSYNPFILDVSGSYPFETHPTLQSVRHYIEIPEISHSRENVDKELQARYKPSWVQSWNWLHDGEDKFPSLKSIVGVYKCEGASESEKDLLCYVKRLGGYDSKLTFVCTLQCNESRIY